MIKGKCRELAYRKEVKIEGIRGTQISGFQMKEEGEKAPKADAAFPSYC